MRVSAGAVSVQVSGVNVGDGVPKPIACVGADSLDGGVPRIIWRGSKRVGKSI